MEEIISSAINSFSKFLNENAETLRSNQSTNLIISFAIETRNFSLDGKIDELLKGTERSFYFEKPYSDFKLFAKNEILSFTENGDGRFSITDKKIKEWKDCIVNNWDIIGNNQVPLLLGGMKFMVEHSDNAWQEFNDSAWFIPRSMVLQTGSKSFIITNFIYPVKSSTQALVSVLRSKLEYFFKLESKEIPSLPGIRKIDGNSPKEKKKWKQIIEEALEEIEQNNIQKVVLARKVELLLVGAPAIEAILQKFRADYNSCNLFIFHKGNSFFWGASPELLGRFSQGTVKIDALAGSAKRGTDKTQDIEFENQLLSSQKDISEHKFVVDHLKNLLSIFSDNITVSEKPGIKKLPNIQHLFSEISAELNSDTSILSVLKEIYPTPAICGSPKGNALHLIKKLEKFNRGLYSGIIGWFNFDNEGEFIVALRSAVSTGQKVTAFAGSGIVRDSNPDEEFLETNLKLKPVMTLFVNEN